MHREVRQCILINNLILHFLTGSIGRFGFVEKFEYEGHQYLFHVEPRSWEEAIEVCQKEGGYLAVLEDVYEVNFVSHAMRGHLCTKTGKQFFFQLTKFLQKISFSEYMDWRKIFP